jgi:hypothetical protein
MTSLFEASAYGGENIQWWLAVSWTTVQCSGCSQWIFGTRPRVQGMKYHPIHGVYRLLDT